MNEGKEGRYVGDLDAVLDHDPTERKPFRVTVWEWRNWIYDEKGTPPKWRTPLPAFGGKDVPHVKEFRTLDKALAHLFEVRARAEYPIASKKIRSSAEARREVLA